MRSCKSTYDVTSWATDVAIDQLRSDSTDYPADVQATYLQLPASLPQRVRDLAERIVGSAHTPYDKAIRLQDYLRLTYPYRLDVPPPPAGRDVVDYFLFEAPGGFCTYYASAMAVMLRAEQVPARVVTGFASGEYDPQHDAYRVPASAAHAWVEVYFPTYGWIEFEPTATLATFEYHASTESSLSSSPGGSAEAASPFTAAHFILGLAVLIGAVILFQVIKQLTRRRDPRWREVDRQARGLYWQMRRGLEAIGLEATANVTPIEFLNLAEQRLTKRGNLFAAVQCVTELYIDATFSAKRINPDVLRISRRVWRQATTDRIKLWLQRLPQRLRRSRAAG
jgi:transglutaminase-like putative cysteine protease